MLRRPVRAEGGRGRIEQAPTPVQTAPAPEPVTVSAAATNVDPPVGDVGALRHRLELVLGGPPGFTTGARAELLADLLRESGRTELLALLHREWISQFDTGPEASSSVTKPRT